MDLSLLPSNISSHHESRFIPSHSSSNLFILLPPCLILLAIDIAVRTSRRLHSTASVSDDESSTIPIDPLSHLASRAQRVLSSFRELESHYAPSLSLEISRCRTLRLSDNSSGDVRTQSIGRTSKGKKHVSKAFTGFCERLLLTNRVLRQEREIKVLKKACKSSKDAQCSAAFKSFCTQLLLSNSLWRKQREIEELRAEQEKMKRSRIGVVTRAARQMVLDVQKERLIEEFVKDLIAETAENRKSIADLRLNHEKEVCEMAGEWRREYGLLSREVERLRLAREASLVEQDISNQLEDRLSERLHLDNNGPLSSCVENSVEAYESDGDTFFEDMSNMSSSTCVSPGIPCPTKTSHNHQHHRARLPSSKHLPSEAYSSKPAIRKVNTRSYAGFSFNPLFFGCGEVSPKETTVETTQSTPTQLDDDHKRSSWQKYTNLSVSSPRVRSETARPSPPSARVAWRV